MDQPNTEYDAIAEAYKASKQLSFRKYIEEHTLFAILGDIRGATVLDLACGEGFYTRKLKCAGARSIIGVDISAKMIELANREERIQPLGCQYLQQDVAELEFADFQWVGPHLHPSQQRDPFWAAFMARPPVIGFSASKPTD